MFRTQLSIFDANASAKRAPQVDEVGDDYTLVLLNWLRVSEIGGPGVVKWRSGSVRNWFWSREKQYSGYLKLSFSCIEDEAVVTTHSAALHR